MTGARGLADDVRRCPISTPTFPPEVKPLSTPGHAQICQPHLFPLALWIPDSDGAHRRLPQSRLAHLHQTPSRQTKLTSLCSRNLTTLSPTICARPSLTSTKSLPRHWVTTASRNQRKLLTAHNTGRSHRANSTKARSWSVNARISSEAETWVRITLHNALNSDIPSPR